MSAQGTTDNSIFQHFLSSASFAKCCAFAMSAAFARELDVVKSQNAWTKLAFDPNTSSAAAFFRQIHEFNETHQDFWEFSKSHVVITKIQEADQRILPILDTYKAKLTRQPAGGHSFYTIPELEIHVDYIFKQQDARS